MRRGMGVEFLKFGMVGGVGLLVDLSVIALLVEGAGLWFGWARLAGFAAAVSLNFYNNDRFTFSGAREAALPVRYLRFVGTSLIGMSVNYAVSMALYRSVPWFAQHYPAAAAAGVVAGMGINFTGARFYAFRGRADGG